MFVLRFEINFGTLLSKNSEQFVHDAQDTRVEFVENTDNVILKEKKVCFLSLGCKVNAYETEMFREQFEKAGAVTIPFEAGNADIVVINTCSVTNVADRKSRQMLHRARKLSPDAVIVATGCYVQAVGEDTVASQDADVAAGNDRKSEVIALAAKYLKEIAGSSKVRGTEPAGSSKARETEPAGITGTSEDKATDVSTKMSAVENPDMQVGTVMSGADTSETDDMTGCHERTRAFIKVTDGCNQFCAYCIIPYVRGRVRSRSVEDVTKEVIKLRDSGYREVVLTGIHLSSYGADSDNYEKAVANGFNGKPLLELIDAVSAIDGIERIRLGSLEPRIITEDFIGKLKNNPKVCPHFHLSLQSGSDTVLKRMKRHYTTADYENACRIIRDAYELPSINTDIIVGFPQETDGEFQQTLEFAEKTGFAKIHIFKYSRRKGTLADKMPGQIDENVKNKRSALLKKIDQENHLLYIRGFVGKNVTILTEQEENIVPENGEMLSGTDTALFMTGLTERYVKVAVPAAGIGQNCFVRCNITGISADGILIGNIIKNGDA